MKLLENSHFELISEALSTDDSSDGKIEAKLESYRFTLDNNFSNFKL